MSRNTEIISVSITKEQAKWLDMSGFGGSELIQDAINEKIELYNKFNQETVKLTNNILSLQKEISVMCEYIELQGKFDEYRKWRGETHG